MGAGCTGIGVGFRARRVSTPIAVDGELSVGSRWGTGCTGSVIDEARAIAGLQPGRKARGRGQRVRSDVSRRDNSRGSRRC